MTVDPTATDTDPTRTTQEELDRALRHLRAIYLLDCTCPDGPAGPATACDDGCVPDCTCAPCIAEHALYLCGDDPRAAALGDATPRT